MSTKAYPQSGSALLQLAENEACMHEKRSAHTTLATPANGLTIDVIHYGCYWTVNPANDSIKGKVAITFKAKQNLNQITLDLANNMIVDQIRFRGQQVTSSFTDTATLLVNLAPQSMNLNEKDSLVIWYHGKPIPSTFGSYSRVIHAGVPVIYTLSEPYGAKDWWPCKQVNSDKADSVDFTVYTPAPNVAVSNGLLINQTEVGGIRTYHWKHKYPVATYLLAIAVTNFEHFRLKAVLSSGDTLPIDHYCYPESKALWVANMPSIVNIMQDFDTVFCPYPFAKEKYGHCEFAFGGGMEHQTISFMQNTDYGLQAHELAHHWFGDKITCGSWRDIWLNEGFATYIAAMEFVKAGFSTWPQEGQQWIDYITSSPGGSVYCDDTTDISRVFNSRLSYAKGAMLLRMLQFQIGDVAFWNGIRAYITSPELSYGFIKTADFKGYMEQASGQNLTEFFKDWYMGQGYAGFHITATNDGPNLQLYIHQTHSHNSVSFYEGKIPIRVSGNGEDTTLIIDMNVNDITENFVLPFTPTTVEFDPEHYLLARGIVTLTTANSTLWKNRMVEMTPNPAQNVVRFEGCPAGTTIRIISLVGQEVYQSYSVNDPIVDISSFQDGMYQVIFSNHTGNLTKKLLIQK